MTQEKLNQANSIAIKIEQCDKALQYMTHGVFHKHDKYSDSCLPLPEDVCMEIRCVIEKYKNDFENQFKEL